MWSEGRCLRSPKFIAFSGIPRRIHASSHWTRMYASAIYADTATHASWNTGEHDDALDSETSSMSAGRRWSSACTGMPERLEKRAPLSSYLGIDVVQPLTLERHQLVFNQRLHVSTVQLLRFDAVVDQ